jgi:hypothetical protein
MGPLPIRMSAERIHGVQPRCLALRCIRSRSGTGTMTERWPTVRPLGEATRPPKRKEAL